MSKVHKIFPVAFLYGDWGEYFTEHMEPRFFGEVRHSGNDSSLQANTANNATFTDLFASGLELRFGQSYHFR